jgi:hypothetical protein
MTTTTKNPVFDPKKIEEQRFEFVLYINNHIICQRYFHIRDFNEESVNSLEMKHLMDSICGMNLNDFGAVGIIPNHLKNKSIDFLWNTYNPYSTTTEQSTKNIYDKIDDFQFEIRIDKQTVAKTMFSGNPFPPKVRYAVDIKEIIPTIMSEIRSSLSQKNYTKVVA